MRMVVGSLASALKANSVSQSARKPSKKVSILKKSFIGRSDTLLKQCGSQEIGLGPPIVRRLRRSLKVNRRRGMFLRVATRFRELLARPDDELFQNHRTTAVPSPRSSRRTNLGTGQTSCGVSDRDRSNILRNALKTVYCALRFISWTCPHGRRTSGLPSFLGTRQRQPARSIVSRLSAGNFCLDDIRMIEVSDDIES
jgi:hypothetical protein